MADHSQKIIQSINRVSIEINDDDGIFWFKIYLWPRFKISPEIKPSENWYRAEDVVKRTSDELPKMPFDKILDVLIRSFISKCYKHYDFPDFETRHDDNKEKCIKLFKETFLGA